MMEPLSYNASDSHYNTQPDMKGSMSRVLLNRQSSEKLQTVSGLKQELGQLRESTKDALQKSWAEVEELQEKVTAHLAHANALERELEISRSKEQEWKRRCEEQMATIEMYRRKEEERAQQAAAVSNQNALAKKSKKQRRSSILQTIMTRRSSVHNSEAPMTSNETSEHSTAESETSSDVGDYWLDTSRRIVNSAISPNSDQLTQDKREELESELSRYLKNIDADKGKTIDELNTKISGCESAISELERNAQDQCNTAKMMSAELESLRTKSGVRQMALTKEIEKQKKRVHEKKKIIVEQREKLEEYQQYISGLTNELERMSMEQDDIVVSYRQR